MPNKMKKQCVGCHKMFAPKGLSNHMKACKVLHKGTLSNPNRSPFLAVAKPTPVPEVVVEPLESKVDNPDNVIELGVLTSFQLRHLHSSLGGRIERAARAQIAIEAELRERGDRL